jgi:hypothetical protein
MAGKPVTGVAEMKMGRSLQDLAAEIERQAKTKRDFLANTETVEIVPMDNNIAVKLGDKGQYPVGDIAHGQIGQFTGIPMPYYNKMRNAAPELLATNVEEWFNRQPAVRLNRTLDGGLRAFLSDRFRPFDNYDFAAAALPILSGRKLSVMSSEITEKRLYLKVVDEKLFQDVPVGFKMGDGSHRIFETCAPALILSNSEVGFGRLLIETGIYTSACTNLALFAKGGMRRTHVGVRHELLNEVDDLDDILSDAAKRKSMEALWLQARDVIEAAFDKTVVTRRVEQMQAAADNNLPAKKVEAVMEVVQKRFDLTNDERGSVLEHLINGGQLNQFGLHAAVTRSAQDAEDYDRATELEYLGGRILELPKTEWEEMAKAA